MKKITCILFVTSLALLTGCESSYTKSNRRHITSEVNVDKPIEGRPTLGMPIQLPESEVFVVPFTIDRPKRWLEDADQFQTSSLSASKMPQSVMPRRQFDQDYSQPGLSRWVRWHNAVIGGANSKGKLVLDRKGIISKLEIVGPWVEVEDPDREKDDPIEYKFVPKATLFLATLEDSDGDGQLTDRDPNVLIAGDLQAGGLHPITPPNAQVTSTFYNAELNHVLIMVTSDTNGDGFFTVADSAAPYIYTPGDAGVAKPLIDPLLTIKAERLLK